MTDWMLRFPGDDPNRLFRLVHQSPIGSVNRSLTSEFACRTVPSAQACQA